MQEPHVVSLACCRHHALHEVMQTAARSPHRGPDRLMASPELGGNGAYTPGHGENEDRRFLAPESACERGCDTGAVRAHHAALSTADWYLTGAEVQNRQPIVSARQVLKVRIRPPANPRSET